MSPEPKTETAVMVPQRHFSLVPQTITDAMTMAKMIAESDFAPKDYRGKPGNVLVAIQMGLDVGLKPMQALQNIAVINGRPSIWGDAALALAQNSDVVEWVKEWFEGKRGENGAFPDDYTAICQVKRKNNPEPTTRKFSVRDAKTALLWGKTGQQGQPTPWVTYPERMLQMRARSFALRDAAADALMGLSIREEAEDLPVIDVQAVVVETEQGQVPAIYLKIPDAYKEAVERAFGTLEMPKGLRLAKLNEFLGGDADPELGTQALLNWCRDEFANRQGKTRVVGPQNNTKAPVAGSASSSVETPVQAAGPVGGDTGDRPATVESGTVASSVASAPLKSTDMKWGF